MTDKELGTAAGDIFAKAFTLGYETGRKYVPADEMRLTAELAEDLRMVLDSFGFNQVTPKVIQAIEAAERLNRALFPATEPAEFRGNLSESPVSSPADPWASRAQDITRAWMRHLGYSEGEVDSLEHAKHEDYGCEREDGGWSCYGESGDSLHKDWDEYDAAAQLVMFVLDPAPAVPAEEETKADSTLEALRDLFNGGPDTVIRTTWHDGVEYWEVPADDMRKILSSPVVPAPTETGPWATVKSDGQQQNPMQSDVGNGKI